MEKFILAACSYYKKTYFFNFEEFADLSYGIQQELQKIATSATEQICGEVIIGIYSNGQAYIEARGADDDYDYDEIGAKYFINDLIREQEELLEQLSVWYLFTRANEMGRISCC